MMKSTPSSSYLTKVLAALCGLTAVLVLSAGTASAQYNVPATVTASTSTPTAGGSITVTAKGFVGTVQFSVESTPQALGSAVANSSGVATLTTTLPANLSAGAHTIRAVGVDRSGAPLNVTTSITVVAAAGATTTTTTTTAAASPTGLAATGSSSAGLVRIGVVIAVLGGLLLLAGKRRTETV